MASFYPTQSGARYLKDNNILYTGGKSTLWTATVSSQTRQVRISTNISGGIYAAIADSTANAAANPSITPSSNGAFVAANNFPEYFTISPGQIVAINSTSTTTGVVTITEMTN